MTHPKGPCEGSHKERKLHLKLLKIGIAIASVFAFSGGAIAQKSQRDSFDVNDLSVLYPIKSFVNRHVGGSLVYLDDEKLISNRQFKQVLGIFKSHFKLDFRTGGQAVLMNKLSKWAVVGFRIDHCFRRQLSDPCKEQVRIVAQAMTDDQTKATDFALHLFYEPSASTEELVGEMIRIREEYAKPGLKKATLGKPLGVHPILKRKNGLASTFARKLKTDFLHRYLNPKNMTEIAVSFVEPERLQPWVFFREDAQNLREPVDHSIFTFDPQNSPNRCGVKSGRLICKRDFSTGKIIDSDEKRNANPNGNAPKGFTRDGRPYLDDFLTIVQKGDHRSRYPAIQKKLKYWEGVFNFMENPKLSGPGDTNCSSCHRTTPDQVRFRGYFTFDTVNGKNAYKPGNLMGCTPGGAIDYNRVGMRTFTVRMFGYMHENPIIANRVINETLEVCKHLKKIL